MILNREGGGGFGLSIWTSPLLGCTRNNARPREVEGKEIKKKSLPFDLLYEAMKKAEGVGRERKR